MGRPIAGAEPQGLAQACFRLRDAALHQTDMAEVVMGLDQLGPLLHQGGKALGGAL
jgi:hypothetical protein